MRKVGIRELKNRLSEYLRSVAAGETILITDHGRPVAELVKPGSRVSFFDSALPNLQARIENGTMSPPTSLDRVGDIPLLTMCTLDHRVRDNWLTLGYPR